MTIYTDFVQVCATRKQHEIDQEVVFWSGSVASTGN